MEIQKQEVILKIEDLTKSFGKTEVLKGISMEVHKNEIISIGSVRLRKVHLAEHYRRHAGSRWRTRDYERADDL